MTLNASCTENRSSARNYTATCGAALNVENPVVNQEVAFRQTSSVFSHGWKIMIFMTNHEIFLCGWNNEMLLALNIPHTSGQNIFHKVRVGVFFIVLEDWCNDSETPDTFALYKIKPDLFLKVRNFFPCKRESDITGQGTHSGNILWWLYPG